jgi:hypothetical protein
VDFLAGTLSPDPLTWGQAFPRPVRPTLYNLTILDDATAVVRNQGEAVHNALLADYALFACAEQCTSKFIQDMIGEVHYKELKVTGTFYKNVSAYTLLEHLETNCGGLHTTDLINLPTQMIVYYANTAGILEYIDQLEATRKKLEQGNLPMTDQ